MRWLLVTAAVMIVAAPAAADDREARARELFAEGNEHYKRKEYEQALAKYRAAYEEYPAARILLNMGTTLVALGRNAEALGVYELYLADPDADPKKRKAVEAELARLAKLVGRVHVVVTSPGATVFLDDQSLGDSPRDVTLRVDPGIHRVRVMRDGAAVAEASVDVAAGEEELVALDARGGGTVVIQTPPPDESDPVPDQDPPPDEGGDVIDAPPPPPPVIVRGAARPRRLGAFALVEADLLNSGLGWMVGGAVRLGDRVELALAGVGGADPAVYAGVSLYLGAGTLAPYAAAGVPVFFTEGGAVAGVQAAVGLEWRASAAFALFAHVAGAYLPGAAPDHEAYVLPAVGVKVRR